MSYKLDVVVCLRFNSNTREVSVRTFVKFQIFKTERNILSIIILINIKIGLIPKFPLNTHGYARTYPQNNTVQNILSVLIPKKHHQTFPQNLQRLSRTGFQIPVCFLKYLKFDIWNAEYLNTMQIFEAHVEFVLTFARRNVPGRGNRTEGKSAWLASVVR